MRFRQLPKSLKIQGLHLGFNMNFKRRIEWRKWLAVAGWVALGYFIGRPEQLGRIARHMEARLAENQRYIAPVTLRTTVAPVLVYRQPSVVTNVPQAHSWNQFSHSEGRFSVMIPSVPVESDSDGYFYAKTANEVYSFGYQPDLPDTRLITEQGKQSIMEEAASSFNFKNFTVVSKRRFGLNGVPGVEIHLRNNSPNEPGMIMRKMIANDRMYTIAVTSPYPQNAQTFLNSFRPY